MQPFLNPRGHQPYISPSHRAAEAALPSMDSFDGLAFADGVGALDPESTEHGLAKVFAETPVKAAAWHDLLGTIAVTSQTARMVPAAETKHHELIKEVVAGQLGVAILAASCVRDDTEQFPLWRQLRDVAEAAGFSLKLSAEPLPLATGE